MSSIVSAVAGDADALRGNKERISAVLHLIRKDGPLTKKQLEFCNDACVERYLKARGYNVRRAAKLLKATLAWRENFDVDYLIADEFTAELASGVSYVAGHDNEGRPVVIVRRKNFTYGAWSQKQYLRYLIFTMEVAVASMRPGVDQWVLVIDMGHAKLSSPSSSTILGTLRILNEHYPERLAKAYIVDSPSVLYFLWKSICPFVGYGSKGKVTFASSKDHALNEAVAATSNRNPAQDKDGRPSLRRLLQESPSFRAQRPERSSSNESALVNSPHCRSLSFSTPGTAFNTPALRGKEFSSFRADRNSWVPGLLSGNHSRKLKAGEGHSFRLGRRPELQLGAAEQREKSSNSFRQYWKFFRAEYNESAYRATMKPPHGGLKSIIGFSMMNNLT
ncbi:hypothetical protein Mapa_014314 [Marchantia paleacea]|nr:hypothetical protein Mapa_014314 [Marchantia paleacea]